MDQLILDYTPYAMVGIFGFLILASAVLVGKSVYDIVTEKKSI